MMMMVMMAWGCDQEAEEPSLLRTDPLTGRASGRPGTLQVVRQILQTVAEEAIGQHFLNLVLTALVEACRRDVPPKPQRAVCLKVVF